MDGIEQTSGRQEPIARQEAFRAGRVPSGTNEASASFHIVGIGASAGGLEALERLFNDMPPDCGMAFVVIQHLSPDFKSLMDELLARHTRLAIHRVEDGMQVQPNSIYLIPPKKEMIISGGRLLLTDKDPKLGFNLPIDIFFRSLAQDVGPRAIAIVLSGTGSDGSRGIRDVHEAGGLVIVQSEETAKFNGMPRSAIETGVVDLVVPPEAIPDALLRFARHTAGSDAARFSDDAKLGDTIIEEGMDDVFRLLRKEYLVDFTHYKPSTVARRVQRRLLLNHVADLDDYVERLRNDPAELNALYRDLLIGVTRFFRDADAYRRLETEVLPQILMRTSPGEELRVWVAGCATGEEAYSIAMLLVERQAEMNRQVNVKIFATDVHRASLDFASAGCYGAASLSEVNPARLEQFFVQRNGGYQVTPELRKLIVFAPHNVLRDAPFTRLDLISCRNLLIYLQPVAQKKILSLFHFGLNTGGVLFMGPSESPGELSDEFDVVDHQWKIFRKRRDVRLAADLRLPVSGEVLRSRPSGLMPSSLHAAPDVHLMRAYDMLLDQFVPPSLLINERRELVHSFAGAGRLLRVRDGRPTADVLDMIDEPLRLPLAGAIQRALKEQGPVVYTGIRLASATGEKHIKLSVKPVADRASQLTYMLVSFEDLAPLPVAPLDADPIDIGQVTQQQLASLESELRYTKENLQATIEELETSNEELQATNEELVASNEELQSTNEELHSVNEELYTVNAEYQRKIAELTELTDDMDNLLRSTEIGTLFIDRDLRIRKFTPHIAQLFNLLPHDVGRRVDSFSHNILRHSLLDDVGRVLESGERFETAVRDRSGNHYLLRIAPYLSDGHTEGAVLTLVDINSLRRAEGKLRLMSKVFMDSTEPIVIEDLSGRVIDLNAEAERVYGWSREEILGQHLSMIMPSECRSQADELRRRCRMLEHVRNVETTRQTKSGKTIPVLLTLSLLNDEAGDPVAIASMAQDITARKQAEEEVREEIRRRDYFLAMLSHELRNPLGAILNATSLLERVGEHQGGSAEARAVIERQARQMARLLDDLLDVSRITQNKIEVHKQHVDLRATAADAVEVVRPLVAARGQRLSVELADEPVPVFGDPARLQQIQVNLLNNAHKYTPAGGEIRLTIRREADEAVLTVSDTGEGIPVDMLNTIFDLFVQRPATLDRSNGGIGVGLTLVRTLVRLHQGTVQALSDGPGTGSRFVVRLPLCKDRTAPPAPDSGPAPPLPASSVPAARILIVEDNADSRQMLQTLLELDGHRVEVAEDGLKGLDALKRGEFDVALVDIGLPGLDGYQVARCARAELPDRRPLLVALTGYGQPSDRQAVLEAGFDEHLVKPLKPEELDRILAERGSWR